MRKKLGHIKRGIQGLLQSRENIPEIPTGLTEHLLTHSVENRKIPYYSLGNGKKKLLVVGAIHGNEVGTVKLAQEIIGHFHVNLPQNLTLFVIPCLNPDGYEQAKAHPGYFSDGRTGRFNAHGVDMNRNFDTPSFQSTTNWGFGKDYSEAQEVFAGEKPGSEPETAALMSFIKKENISLYIALHSAGKDVMPSDDPKAKELVQLFCQKTGFRYFEPEPNYIKRHTGTAREWCEVQKIPYVEIEASSRWGSDWKNQKAGFIAVLERFGSGM